MPVTGGRQVANRLRRVPQQVEARVKEALEEGAGLVLMDMKALTPVDADNPGPHARDGLTIRYSDDGLTAHIGLPTQALAQDFFWFRFLDGGTRGGEASYRHRKTGTRVTVRVPARAALRIREKAMEGNRPEVLRLVENAIEDGIRARVNVRYSPGYTR